MLINSLPHNVGNALSYVSFPRNSHKYSIYDCDYSIYKSQTLYMQSVKDTLNNTKM